MLAIGWVAIEGLVVRILIGIKGYAARLSVGFAFSMETGGQLQDVRSD